MLNARLIHCSSVVCVSKPSCILFDIFRLIFYFLDKMLCRWFYALAFICVSFRFCLTKFFMLFFLSYYFFPFTACFDQKDAFYLWNYVLKDLLHCTLSNQTIGVKCAANRNLLKKKAQREKNYKTFTTNSKPKLMAVQIKEEKKKLNDSKIL